MTHLHPASVRVPCSTSNLGSGFDVLGVALNRYLEAAFEPGGESLQLIRSGTLEGLDVPDAEDLLLAAFLGAVDAKDRPVTGVLTVRSDVPVARGLGSSAAAVVAGHALGQVVSGVKVDAEAAYRAALAVDGHGDNAGPCALGGFRAAVPDPGGTVRSLSLPLSPEVGFAYAAPGGGVSTAEARAALPRQVDHATAVGGLGRITALLRGLAEGDPELVRPGVEDALHVPFRLPLIPGAADAMEAGREAGAWAVTISGAGSGLIAFCDRAQAHAVADAMRERFAGRGPGSIGFALEADLNGLSVAP